jgi:phosphatidylserine decarboxylase
MIRTLKGTPVKQPQTSWAHAGIFFQKWLEPAKLSRWVTQRCNNFHQADSKSWIASFADKYNIARSTIPQCKSTKTDSECWDKFDSLNQFFTRTRVGLPRVSKTRTNVVVSPADAYTIYLDPVRVRDKIWIKGTSFTLKDFFDVRKSLPKDLDYHLFIFRLAPHHYHRYHVPVCGWITAIRQVGSQFFSVDPEIVRSTVDVFTRNVRVLIQIETYSGDTLFLGIVGATCVGSVRLTNPAIVAQFERDTSHVECTDRTLASLPGGYRPRRKIPIYVNDELGMFEYGGSSILLCAPQKGFKLSPSGQIVARHSQEPWETELTVGEKILSL